MRKCVIWFLIPLFFSGIAFGDEKGIKRWKKCQNYEKKAMIIGVGDYRNDNDMMSDLKGPKNDVAMIKDELLMTVLGYKSQEIAVLQDQQATKANIIRLMENWFLKGDQVRERFFYFSGHGSRINDIDGDEPDGDDEVILPHDVAYDSNFFLRPETVLVDDQLRAWFETLSGKRLVAILDSCHSGSGFRSLGKLDGVPVATPRYAKSRYRSVSSGRIETSVGDATPENHVYLYAAQSSQVAMERQFKNGRHQGCFTTALIQTAKALSEQARRESAKAVSYLELFTALNETMKHKMNLEQTPDIQPEILRGKDHEEYKVTGSAELLNPFFAVASDAPSTRVQTRLPDVDRHKINVLISDESRKNLISPSDLGRRHAAVDFKRRGKSYDLYVSIHRDSVRLTNANGFLLNRFGYSGKTDLVRGIEKRIRHAFLKDILDGIESPHGFPMSVKVEYQGKPYEKNDFYGGQEITYIIESQVDAYLYVISVDAGGELNLYLPFEHQKDNKVKKGGRIRILDEKLCGDEFVLEISSEPGEEILKVVAAPTALRIRMAKERGEHVSRMTFEETLNNVRDMIAQLKAADVWYEGTRKYMNHTLEVYEKKFK